MKVVVVDDDAEILRMIVRVLAHHGHEVHGCATPFGVGAVVLRVQPDLVLLDVMMPGLSGPSLADVVKQLPLAHAPRIVLWSAMDSAELQKTATETGLPTLTKSLAPSKIVAELERLSKRQP